MGLVATDARWFKLIVKPEAVVADIIGFFRAHPVPYMFGPFFVWINVAQKAEIEERFKGLLSLAVSIESETDWEIKDDVWDLPDRLYEEALRPNHVVLCSDEDYYHAFVQLFKTDSRGALVVRRAVYEDIALFAVRFSHRIKTLSGMQCWVPHFSTDDACQNKAEIFRLFVAAYPAYRTLIRNMNWANKFYWAYNIETE